MSLSKLRKSRSWRHTTFAWFAGLWMCLIVAIIVIEKPSMAHAATTPVTERGVSTFTCEWSAADYHFDKFEQCGRDVDGRVNAWLKGEGRFYEIIDQKANIAAAPYGRGYYVVTIFYRK